MDEFSNRLKELMEDKGIDAKNLAQQLNIANTATIYNWLRAEKGVSIDTAITIADFFQCSLNYLFARSDDDKPFESTKVYPPFDVQFRKVLTEQKVSQYQLLKDKLISRGNLNNWLNKKHTPHMKSVIKIADYLDITLDELVGRDFQQSVKE